MTRIIGGAAGGRRLKTPPGSGTRPTSDRVREALFSSLEAWAGSLSGLAVLDVYAGSGAVGLEAWSRGAEVAWFVEADRKVAALIEANARDLGCEVAHVESRPALHVLVRQPPRLFDVAFLDPPYDLDEDELTDVLALLPDWVTPDALVVVERSKRSPEPTWPEGWATDRKKRYGETTLWYGLAL